jgi:8-oxo-dGTP pyrophosphatase MutT (NUDIX family)
VSHVHTQPGQLDLVVGAFLVHPREPRVLLVKHKALDLWLQPGGHVELHETSDEALARELEEETGLQTSDVVWYHDSAYVLRKLSWARMGPAAIHNSRQLLVPWAVEVHDFPPLPGHRHLCLAYLGQALTAAVRLEAAAHDAIEWFSHADLEDPARGVRETVRWYGHAAIDRYEAAPRKE